MESSVMERMRRLQNEVDQLEIILESALEDVPVFPKGRVETEHMICNAVAAVQKRSQLLLALDADADRQKQAEIQGWRPQAGDPVDVLFDRLDELLDEGEQESKQSYGLQDASTESQSALFEEIKPKVSFSDEECWGRFVDMNEPFELYRNIPGAPQTDYTEFLKRGPVAPPEMVDVSGSADPQESGTAHSAAPSSSSSSSSSSASSSSAAAAFASMASGNSGRRMRPREREESERLRDASYRAYLRSCTGYLARFARRARPLEPLEQVLEPAYRDFCRAAGLSSAGPGTGQQPMEGPEGGSGEAARARTQGGPGAGGEEEHRQPSSGIDLGSVTSAEELLERHDGEALRNELLRLGLKTGGRPQDRAKRLWKTKGKSPEEWPRGLWAKGRGPKDGQAGSGGHGGPGTAGMTDVEAAAEAALRTGGRRQAFVGGATASSSSSSSVSQEKARSQGGASLTISNGTGSSAAVSALAPAASTASTGTLPFSDQVPRGGALESRWLEHALRALWGTLQPVMDASRTRAERRQTLTEEERQKEIEEEAAAAVGEGEAYGMEGAAGGEGEDGETDAERRKRLGRRYKKNLVVDVDGKPIPYWLYRLHNLNIPFKCEVCGDETYWGRFSYERHFSSPRHTQMLQRLGIPNTKHFFGISKIADAMRLWKRLQAQTGAGEGTGPGAGVGGSASGSGLGGVAAAVAASSGGPQGAQHAEFEDADGNVMSRELYEMMARQGLLGQGGGRNRR